MSEEEKRAQTDENELVAASALACLAQKDRVEAEPEPEPEPDEQQDQEDEDFTIPQRFTKSGRKRAVPFTIKVSSSCLKPSCGVPRRPPILM